MNDITLQVKLEAVIAERDTLHVALERLLACGGLIAEASEDDLCEAANDMVSADAFIREQAAAILQGRAAIRSLPPAAKINEQPKERHPKEEDEITEADLQLIDSIFDDLAVNLAGLPSLPSNGAVPMMPACGDLECNACDSVPMNDECIKDMAAKYGYAHPRQSHFDFQPSQLVRFARAVFATSATKHQAEIDKLVKFVINTRENAAEICFAGYRESDPRIDALHEAGVSIQLLPLPYEYLHKPVATGPMLRSPATAPHHEGLDSCQKEGSAVPTTQVPEDK